MEVRVFGVCDVAKGLKAFVNKRKMSFTTSFFPSNFALWDCLCFIIWQTKQHKMRHDLQKRRFDPDFGTTPSYPFSDITNDSTTPLQLIQCGHFFSQVRHSHPDCSWRAFYLSNSPSSAECSVSD